MRRAICCFCVIALFSLLVQAERPPATQPVPKTASAASEPKPVLILPFAPPSDVKLKDAGRELQQDLANAIAADLRGRVVASPTAAPASNADAALAQGRNMNAGAVIFGQVQVNGEEVRLTGQVLDVNSGKSLGTLKQSGPIENLFHLEDALMPQVVAALPEQLLNLRGLLSTGQSAHPQIIYLPGDAPTPTAAISNAPIDGGYAGPVSPYALPLPPGGSPPYSPNAGSYPYRFSAPYAHLFSYDYDPDPFLPLYGGFYSPDRFGARGSGHPTEGGAHEAHAAPRR